MPASPCPRRSERPGKLPASIREIAVEPQVADLIPQNVESLLGSAGLILDGTDNFETRYLINDYAVKNSVAWIYAAAVGSYAVTMNILPGETACLACIFPDSPRGTVETCETAGILNSAVNLVASIAATEALKLLVGAPAKMRRTLLSWDVWRNEQAEVVAASPRTGCRTCGDREFVHLAGEGRPHITLCGRNSVQIHERERPVDFAEMSARLNPLGSVRHNELRAEILARPLRDDPLPRRPRHHQRHDGHGHCPQPLRPLYRELTRSPRDWR